MSDKRLIASAKALNRLINSNKKGENPAAIIAKIGRGESIGDDDYGILVELERGIIALMEQLDEFEKSQMVSI